MCFKFFKLVHISRHRGNVVKAVALHRTASGFSTFPAPVYYYLSYAQVPCDDLALICIMSISVATILRSKSPPAACFCLKKALALFCFNTIETNGAILGS